MVLPDSIARWSLFNGKKVTSATIFFTASVFNLSGAINVLLFLTIRPRLLLFSPPDVCRDLKGTKLRQPATGSAGLADTSKYDLSPQSTGKELADDVGDEV
jgi:hypothetical protein